MLLLIKVKDTDNVIGLKEDIAMRLEGVADIERIDVNADVAEVRHGEWSMDYDCGGYVLSCSLCDEHYWIEREDEKKPNYCPNCGAKMDGERYAKKTN